MLLAAAISLPARRAAVLSSMILEAGPALRASLPHLHVLSAAMPPPPTLVVRHLKLSFFPREDAQGEAGSLSVEELPTGHTNTGVPELEAVRRCYLARQRVPVRGQPPVWTEARADEDYLQEEELGPGTHLHLYARRLRIVACADSMTSDWLRRQGRRHAPVADATTWQELLRRDPHVARLAAEEERQDGARRSSLVSPTTDDLRRHALSQKSAWPPMRDRKASSGRGAAPRAADATRHAQALEWGGHGKAPLLKFDLEWQEGGSPIPIPSPSSRPNPNPYPNLNPNQRGESLRGGRGRRSGRPAAPRRGVSRPSHPWGRAGGRRPRRLVVMAASTWVSAAAFTSASAPRPVANTATRRVARPVIPPRLPR